MAWDSNVVGGIGPPRVFLLGSDLITNGSFELDDDSDGDPDDWTAIDAPSTFTQFTDTDSFYGDYVLDITCASVADRGRQQVTMEGADINGKDVLAIGYARNFSGGVRAILRILDNNLAALEAFFRDLPDTDYYYQVAGFAENITSGAQSPNANIDVTGGAAYPARFRWENVQFYEVEDWFTLPQPTRWNQDFPEDIQSQLPLIDGRMKKYVNGWRYQAALYFEYLSSANEVSLQKISDHNGLVAFQPHNDIDWFQVGFWNSALERKYFYNRFLGHTSLLPFISKELLDRKPLEVA